MSVVDPYSLSSEYSSDYSSDYSFSSSGDAPLDLNPVNYDKYSSSFSSGTSRSSGSALPPGFGMYAEGKSYSNLVVFQAHGRRYNIDQDEVERIYAELMPKDAGIPVPVVESKSETVVEEVKEDSVEEEWGRLLGVQPSTSEGQTKPAAVTESVSTSRLRRQRRSRPPNRRKSTKRAVVKKPS